jgi:NAD(P)H-hydrate epimerase
MGGAIMLAAEAALRSGVGLARVATRGEHLAPLLARLPEVMGSAVEHRNALVPMLDWADAIVIGPGLGQDAWGEQMLQACLGAGKPLSVDADALNLLASAVRWALPAGSVITPHPGEAARLLREPTAAVQADRFSAAQRLNQRGAAVVLKGNGSIVAGDGALSLCAAGNPGMASGGMGDVLSGIIGGLLAQGVSASKAARLGTLLHATAGDNAAATVGEPGLLASDLLPFFMALIK